MSIEPYIKIVWNNGYVQYVSEESYNNIILCKYNDDIKEWETLGESENIYVIVHEDKLFKLDELL